MSLARCKFIVHTFLMRSWWKQLLFVVILRLARVHPSTATQPAGIVGSTVGDFVLLGSFCIKSSKADISIQTTTQLKNQKILFYDSPPDSFSSINKLGVGASCSDIENLARPICSGRSCTSGYVVPVGTDITFNTSISQGQDQISQWYFVLSNCNNNERAKVDMTSFSITSSTDTPDSCEPEVPKIVCPVGSFSDAQQHKCIPCKPGTFSAVLGATGRNTCKPCNPGSYSTTAGAFQCTLCAAGKSSNAPGAWTESVCMFCNAGESSKDGQSQCTQSTGLIILFWVGRVIAILSAGVFLYKIFLFLKFKKEGKLSPEMISTNMGLFKAFFGVIAYGSQGEHMNGGGTTMRDSLIDSE